MSIKVAGGWPSYTTLAIAVNNGKLQSKTTSVTDFYATKSKFQLKLGLALIATQMDVCTRYDIPGGAYMDRTPLYM